MEATIPGIEGLDVSRGYMGDDIRPVKAVLEEVNPQRVSENLSSWRRVVLNPVVSSTRWMTGWKNPVKAEELSGRKLPSGT